MRSEKARISMRKCLPQLRSATMRSPTSRSLSMRVLPSAATMRLPTMPCACSRRMTIEGPSGTTSPRSRFAPGLALEHFEEAHLDRARPAHADADEDALGDPAQRRRARLEARHAAEVDLGGI